MSPVSATPLLSLPAESGGLQVVDAGTDLDAARPAGADVVYWWFDAGVDVGAAGANITNGQPGDLIYVVDA